MTTEPSLSSRVQNKDQALQMASARKGNSTEEHKVTVLEETSFKDWFHHKIVKIEYICKFECMTWYWLIQLQAYLSRK